jgi:CDP-diacylglycerol--glycerol-3-phosphate 3-phosphatidyltransferase
VAKLLRDLAADLWPITLPMALTLGRLALVPAFLALVVLGHRWSALGLFAAMAATDNLDGRLARRWNQTTRLGTLLDPAADKVLVSCSMVLLAVPRFAPARFAIPAAVPLGVFLKDLGVLIGVAVVIAKVGRVEISAARPGKWSTALDLALVIATLLAPEWVRLSPPFAAAFLWGLWWATVWAAAAAAVGYSREGARQIRAGRRSRSGHQP